MVAFDDFFGCASEYIYIVDLLHTQDTLTLRITQDILNFVFKFRLTQDSFFNEKPKILYVF